MLSPWWTGGVGASGAQAHSQERQSSSQVQVGFLHLDMRVYFVNCFKTGSYSKESACSTGGLSSIPGLGRSLG